MKRIILCLLVCLVSFGVAGAEQQRKGIPGTPSPMILDGNTVKPRNDAWSLSAGLSIHTTIASTPASPLTAADIDGGIIPLSGDGTTVTLPAVSAATIGKFITFHITDATAKHIDTNANDKITLRGTAMDDGEKLSIAVSSAGTMITLYCLDATGWVAPVGTSYNATDGGA